MTYFITKLANAKKNSDIKKPLSAVTGSGRYSQIMEPMNENNFNRNRNESKDLSISKGGRKIRIRKNCC